MVEKIHAAVPSHDVYEGELLKRGWKITNWKRRYFVLKTNLLLYFLQKEDALKNLMSHQGCIPLECVTIELNDKLHEKDFSFCISHPQRRTFIMAAANEEERSTWMKMLDKAVIHKPKTEEKSEHDQKNLGKFKSGSRVHFANSFSFLRKKGEIQVEFGGQPSKKYFLIVSDNVVFCCNHEADEQAHVAFDISGFSISVPSHGRKYSFFLVPPTDKEKSVGSSVYIMAEDPVEMEEWIRAFEEGAKKK